MPRGRLPRVLFNDVYRTTQPFLFLLSGQIVRCLMDVAVIPDFMAVAHNGLDRLRVVFDAPCRDEERLLEAELAEGFQNARDGNVRTVTEHRRNGELFHRAGTVVDVHQTVGVHIQGQSASHLRIVRPGYGVCELHGIVSLQHHRAPLGLMVWPAKNPASGPHRKRTRPAISCGVPIRRSGNVDFLLKPFR